MSLYKNQTMLTLVLDCGINVAGATVKKIFYKKPDKTTGEYLATAAGTKLSYTFLDGQIDMAGIWQFQSYVEIGGKKATGEIVEQVFKEPLK